MAILTVAANDTVAPIHDRMPAILDPADYDDWLDNSVKDVRAAQITCAPRPIICSKP